MKKRLPKKSDLFRRINTHYRLVFIDDESLLEVASFRLTMRKLYILMSTIFVSLVILTVIVLLATPLRYYIPGYGSSKDHKEVVKLKRSVDSLSDLVNAQHQYEENIRKVISGKVSVKRDTTLLDMRRVKQDAMNSMLPMADEIKKDAIKEVKKENNAKDRQNERNR